MNEITQIGQDAVTIIGRAKDKFRGQLTDGEHAYMNLLLLELYQLMYAHAAHASGTTCRPEIDRAANAIRDYVSFIESAASAAT